MTRAPEHKPRDSKVWARVRLDWYVEPEDCTAALLRVERLDDGLCYDPACGQGNIVRTLLAHGVEAVGTDIQRRAPAGTSWFRGHRDYLRPDLLRLAARHVVMNPPYGRSLLAEAFIRRALETTPGKVAAFMPLRFMTGIGRARGLFADRPPHRAWVLAPRPSCPPGEELRAERVKAQGGQADFVWLVWDGDEPPARAGDTRLGFAIRTGATAAATEGDDDQAEAA